MTAEHYRDDIIDYVLRLHANGIYVVLDLHWSAPGTTVITGGANGNQLVTMAFADHALDFWTSVATTFKDDPMVIFDLFNEPILNANDRMGHTAVRIRGAAGATAATVAHGSGRRHAADAGRRVRATGAQQLVVAGGIDWAHQLDGWLANKPTDSTGNLLAGFHVYQRPLTRLRHLDCWDGAVTPVAAQVPVLVGEMGEQDCAHGYIDQFMAWADGKGLSYLGWAWNPQNCNNVPGAGHRLQRHADQLRRRPARPPDPDQPVAAARAQMRIAGGFGRGGWGPQPFPSHVSRRGPRLAAGLVSGFAVL